MSTSLRPIVALALCALSFTACDDGGDDTEDSVACAEGEKCDKPGGTQQEQCLARQSEVLNSSQRGFTPTAIRWAAADVEGVNTNSQDNRGQEYAEYFSIVQLPGATKGVDLGRPRSEAEGDVTPGSICVDAETGPHCGATITSDQLAQLEDDPAAIVGACVFTSWHNDVPGPLPSCPGGKCGDDAKLYGIPFTDEFFRMKIFFNGNGAAADLVKQCLDGTAPQPSSWSSKTDPLTQPFFRGCMQVQGLFTTGWRRSDPSVCAVINRLDECNCSIKGVTRAKMAEAIIPRQPDASGKVTLRGFRLGTWDNPEGLPGGCRYLNSGDTSHTLVACDLTASDVVANLNDTKEVCRRTYGPNVVVHVPIAKDLITCAPDTAKDPGKTCGKMPWNIGKENG